MEAVPPSRPSRIPTGGIPSNFLTFTLLLFFYLLYFVLQGETNNTADINLSRLSELLARSFCVALTPHLSELYTTGHTHLGLRTTLHQDNVSLASIPLTFVVNSNVIVRFVLSRRAR